MSSISGSGSGGGGGVGNVKFLEGNSGGQVGPDTGGLINIVGTGDIDVTGNPGTNTLEISFTGSSGGIETINGDSGSITGPTVSFSGSSAGGTVTFSGSGTAMSLNFTGSGTNTALGNTSGNFVAGASNNTSLGSANFQSTNSGTDSNVAIGNGAMNTCPGASACVAIGNQALINGVGTSNVAIGNGTLGGLDNGSFNTCIGTGVATSFFGAQSSNIFIGYLTGSGIFNESNVLRIGNGTGTSDGNINEAFISGIRGITTINNNAVAVLIDSDGQLGTVSSSIRYKENVRSFDSSALLKTNPVVFNYKNHTHDQRSYGLIAEEVQELLPDLVVRDKDGLPETIKYHELPVYLLAELKKAVERIKALESKLEGK